MSFSNILRQLTARLRLTADRIDDCRIERWIDTVAVRGRGDAVCMSLEAAREIVELGQQSDVL